MAGDVVGRARELIGTRFRPQGRSPDTGIDCIGVAAIALALPMGRIPSDYRLRGGDRLDVENELARHLVTIAVDEARAGDLLLVEAGPGQLHVVILTPGGHLHADATIRRVVEVPGRIAWPVLSAWRNEPDRMEGTR